MLPELARIDRYRLDHDLTWMELADEMRRHDLPVHYTTLFRHVKQFPNQVLRDRTLDKVRRFLKLIPRSRTPRINGNGAKAKGGR